MTLQKCESTFSCKKTNNFQRKHKETGHDLQEFILKSTCFRVQKRKNKFCKCFFRKQFLPLGYIRGYFNELCLILWLSWGWHIFIKEFINLLNILLFCIISTLPFYFLSNNYHFFPLKLWQTYRLEITTLCKKYSPKEKSALI